MATLVQQSDRVALWLQRSCTSGLEFLGCHDASDLTEPRGDIVPSYQRTGKGKFGVVGSRQTTPDLGTISFAFYRQIVNLLVDLPCPPNVLIYYSNCGSDDDPTNYDFIDTLDTVRFTETSQPFVANAIGADGETDVGGNVVVEASATFESKLVLKPLLQTDLGANLSELSNRVIADISVCDPDAECGDCDNDTIGCQTLWVITNGSPGTYGDARIFKSTDGGSTWIEQTNSMTIDNDNLSAV